MIYLDNSATSRYKPRSVIEAYQDAILRSANPGRSSHKDSLYLGEQVYNTRLLVNKLLHAPYHVVFTKNCTEALNLAILGTLHQGDHVVTTQYEHNSVLRPLYYLEQRGVITLTIVSPSNDGAISPYRIEEAITPDTRMVICSHISNVTGRICDITSIGRICAKRGILFLVDTAQSIGHIDVDMEASYIDIVCAPAHKGLNGIQGAGFIAFSDRVDLHPIMYGGTGTESESVLQPESPPEAFESGTLPTPAILALGKAIEDNILNRDKYCVHLMDLTAYTVSALSEINGVTLYTSPTSIYGVVAFNISSLPSSEVADRLSQDYDIAVRGGLHCAPLTHKYLGTTEQGAVRVSIGVDNSLHDIKRLLHAVSRIAKT